MIYIPTYTTKLRGKEKKINEKYILYSPNKNIQYRYTGSEITIWDNHTFYYFKRLGNPEMAIEHYKWLINYICENYIEGVTLITPDVDWLQEDLATQIMTEWKEKCGKYPQLYIPNTWTISTDELNIIGHAIRKETVYENIHPKWVHCLAHIRKDLEGKTQLLSYDSIVER